MKTHIKTNLMRLFIAFVFGFLLNACAASPPTNEEMLSADYGSYISQQDAEQQAEQFLKRRLKDPGSAIFEWGQFGKGWFREAPIDGGALKFGYMLHANINAKNSFGGYTGMKPHLFIFYNGNLIGAYGQKELRMKYSSTLYMGKIY